MLFTALLKAHPGTLRERAARRVGWDYPKGIKPVAEYWLQGNDTSAIVVFEVDHPGLITPLRAEWDDLYEIEIFPAMTADEGIALMKQHMQTA